MVPERSCARGGTTRQCHDPPAVRNKARREDTWCTGTNHAECARPYLVKCHERLPAAVNLLLRELHLTNTAAHALTKSVFRLRERSEMHSRMDHVTVLRVE